MKKEDLRIVFMGTPEFAVASLDALVTGGYNVVGVITMPDKPSGRGYHLQTSAVKEYAIAHNLKLLQPEKLKDENFLAQLRELRPDLQIVVAFRMLPEVVWAMPPLGTFNLHASLLPQYRGAAPINWAVINGETETGVTTFFLQHEIDTGNIILQKSTPILPTDNAGIIHDKLKEIGAEILKQTVDDIIAGNVTLQPQPDIPQLRPAPKITKETCQIHWNERAEAIHNLVRGLSPYPGAWTNCMSPDGELTIKIFETEYQTISHQLPIGTIIKEKNAISVATSDGYVRILSLQMPGKKRMTVADFMRGYKNIDKIQMI